MKIIASNHDGTFNDSGVDKVKVPAGITGIIEKELT